MRAGFLLDRLVAVDRNRGVPRRIACRLAASSRAATPRSGFPGLRRQGLTGAAVWYDYVTTESDRLTFSLRAGGRRARRGAGQPRRGDRAARRTASA